ncbi:hypothetical protein K438DRAFT_1776960 [Mycena galopus ATCC 62051]|nr:hypothetical protein K438DRAFT_1776960 [Mycena galopus ATCC 62051]
MAKVFFCLPLCKPEPGHENKEVHDGSPRAHYYVIVSGKEGIVVTTEDAMAREMKPDPNARNFSASTWKEIMDLWIKDYSTPTRAPPKSVTRGHPTHSLSKAAAKPLTTEEVAAKFENIFTTSPMKTKSHRSDRAKAATKPLLNSSAVDDAAHEVGSEPLLLYGVTGHNRLFRSKERAMAVLKATPGADLVFAHDEAGVKDFICTEGSNRCTIGSPRQRTRKSDTGSSTQRVNDAKLKKEEMLAEVEAFQELRHEKVKELAIKYEKDEAFFLKLLANQSQYSATRGLTLWNAFKHDFSKQAKENGDAKSTIELNEELKYKYEELKESMSEDKKKELFAQLEECRELQQKGVRATNKSASADAMQNAARIGEVMKDLYERTGMRAFAMFTCGNPDDPSVPHIEDSDEVRLFFLEHLKMDILDVMRKFKQWSCTRDSGGPKENHKLSVIMKEISEILSEGLYAIVHQLSVELAGWPSWVEMTRTSKLSAEHARDIHQKLRSGAIYWVVLTKSQHDVVAKEIEEQRVQGPLKPRKQRSDKGEECGPRNKPDKTNAAQDGEGKTDDLRMGGQIDAGDGALTRLMAPGRNDGGRWN